ncbi:MAG: TorF family putative porin [Woeseiaceae bacterium]|nr:TorF family putative porin [Woeseiaceae bacterium]
MKTIVKTGVLVSILFASAAANAQWSANVGWASEYHFRGIFQKTSSASGGVDYENDNGFYAGTWAADVGDGLEVDGYFGFGGSIEDFSYGIGFTGYYYTGDFDDTYQEINLSGGYGPFTVDVALGEYENFDGPTQDYTFVSLTLDPGNGFYGTFGTFSQDADGDYLEVGYGTTIAEIDFGVSLILANDDLIGDEDETLIFTIGKGFDL